MDTKKSLLIFFLIVFLPLCDSIYIYIYTITVNQSLTASNVLISEERTFAFGSFSPGKSRYKYHGIWYHKITRQTLVWVVNKNDPISGPSGVLVVNPEMENVF
jgi:hypothetical protein